MIPSHPLNKNWFHISNGYHLKTKHVLGGAIGLFFVIAFKVAIG